MQSGKVNVLIDAQWGSTGKGKLAGILALKHLPHLAVCNFMTNAGHTWVPDEGPPVMVQQIPSCLINPNTLLHIASTAAIDMKVFDGEMKQFNDMYKISGRLTVDPRAMIITPENKEAEAKSLHRVSSTVKGCGAATAEKIMRRGVLASDLNSGRLVLRETENLVHVGLEAGWRILFETAQGFDLSLNHGTRYPFCTSRDITVCQALSDACVPPSAAGHVYASLRAFPIRVGNAFEFTGGSVESLNGWSGPYYPDQKELSWEEVTQISGSKTPLLERTTVTNKVRRIFTFSHRQLDRFIQANDPTYLFINFINYIDSGCYGLNIRPGDVKEFMAIFPKIERFVKAVEEHGVPVAYLGTGPKHSQLVDFGIDN